MSIMCALFRIKCSTTVQYNYINTQTKTQGYNNNCYCSLLIEFGIHYLSVFMELSHFPLSNVIYRHTIFSQSILIHLPILPRISFVHAPWFFQRPGAIQAIYLLTYLHRRTKTRKTKKNTKNQRTQVRCHDFYTCTPYDYFLLLISPLKNIFLPHSTNLLILHKPENWRTCHTLPWPPIPLI